MRCVYFSLASCLCNSLRAGAFLPLPLPARPRSLRFTLTMTGFRLARPVMRERYVQALGFPTSPPQSRSSHRRRSDAMLPVSGSLVPTAWHFRSSVAFRRLSARRLRIPEAKTEKTRTGNRHSPPPSWGLVCSFSANIGLLRHAATATAPTNDYGERRQQVLLPHIHVHQPCRTLRTGPLRHPGQRRKLDRKRSTAAHTSTW